MQTATKADAIHKRGMGRLEQSGAELINQRKLLRFRLESENMSVTFKVKPSHMSSETIDFR